MQPYERIEAWQKAHAFALAAYRATTRWPADERYGLTAQVRRAAFSVPANIVEGRARVGKKEFKRFLDIAWASLAEVEYAIRIARDLGYLTPEGFDELQASRTDAARPLFGLIRSLAQ